MYLALFLTAVLYIFIAGEGKHTPFYRYAVLAACLVCIPVTQRLLLLYFQDFYGAVSLEWILPVFGAAAFAAVQIYGKLWEKWKKRCFFPIVCVVILLSGFLSGSYRTAPDTGKEEREEVYEMILQQSQEEQLLFVAPRELLQYARAYDARFLCVYGRDLWEEELNYAFYDGYDPWMYGLAEYMEGPVEEHREALFACLVQSGADFVVFDKENMTFGEDMQYPAELDCGGLILRRMDETRHFVIYTRA